jgi:hypothetical protein
MNYRDIIQSIIVFVTGKEMQSKGPLPPTLPTLDPRPLVEGTPAPEYQRMRLGVIIFY